MRHLLLCSTLLLTLTACTGADPAPAPEDGSDSPADTHTDTGADTATDAGTTGEQARLRNARQLTNIGVRSGEQYFDHAGERVIFQSVPDDYPFFQIYLLETLDGSAPPRLISTGRGKTTCPWFHPSDSTRFIYASSHLDPNLDATEAKAREAAKTPPKRGGKYQWDFDAHMDIFEAQITPDGATVIRQLTSASGYDAECSYSPDGSKIVFTSLRDGDGEIYVMNADGSDATRITNQAGYDGGPFFSPDGKSICWRGDPQGNDQLQIYICNADGSNVRQLTDNGAVNWAPYFHPDSKRLIYATSIHGHRNYELYLLDIASGREARVTTWEGFDGLPAFNADGSKLIWTSKRGGGLSQVWIADFVDAWAK
jgi:TolB protein